MTSDATGPPNHRFSQVLVRLDASGDARSVVRLVERWSEHGGVTQEARMMEAQQEQQRILSNQSAENAAAQFNAANEQQRDQFMMSLGAQMEQYNSSQNNYFLFF